MTTLYKKKYRGGSIRWEKWDYRWNGAYFITICTKNNQHFFGNIAEGAMHLSEIGEYAQKFWLEIPIHFPFVVLQQFVVMPNHIHGILIIDNHDSEATKQTNSITQIRKFQNVGKNSISSIIGSYKAAVTYNARKTNPKFSWLTRFYDIVIRNESAYNNIANYINNNVSKWHNDKFCDTP